MPTSALYTDVGRVVEALSIQAPETFGQDASAGATSITLNSNAPADWQVGSTLVLDSHNTSLREVVTITGTPFGSTVTVTALVHAHVVGAPIINATILESNDYVAAASRWFDGLTYWPEGFAYEAVTETKGAYVDRDGRIFCPLSKPIVQASDITSATYEYDDLVTPLTLNSQYFRVWNDYLFRANPLMSGLPRNGLLTISYSGGFQTIPEDIALATTILAARLYKERSSGYADVIGNADTGIMQYKKGVPANVKPIVNKYQRVTE